VAFLRETFLAQMDKIIINVFLMRTHQIRTRQIMNSSNEQTRQTNKLVGLQVMELYDLVK